MQLSKPRLRVKLITGEVFDNVVEYSIDSNYLVPTDGWEIRVTKPDAPEQLRRDFRPLAPVALELDGRTVLLGRIDQVESSGTDLTVRGRDYLSDIVDGGVDPTIQVKKGTDIGDAILDAVRPYGITTVFGTNLTRDLLTGKSTVEPPNRALKEAKLEDFKPRAGDGCFEYCARIAARHGMTLQPAGTRDSLLIVAPQYEQEPSYTFVRTRTRAESNIIGVPMVRRGWADVPTVVIATGRGGQAGQGLAKLRTETPVFFTGSPSRLAMDNIEIANIVSTEGLYNVVHERRKPGVRDPNIYAHDFPLYRPQFFEDNDSRNQEQLDAAVRRLIADRLKDTLTYSVTVRGHEDPETGLGYAPDTIATVKDEIELINEPMWVVSRTLMNSGEGPKTRLEMIRPGSFIL